MRDRLEKKIEKLGRSVPGRSSPGVSGQKPGAAPEREEAFQALLDGEVLPEWHGLQLGLSGKDFNYFTKSLTDRIKTGAVTPKQIKNVRAQLGYSLG